MTTSRKAIIILLHAFLGWGLCGATIAIGMAATSLPNTLIIHAIGAPIYFAVISFFYHKKFCFHLALADGGIFTGFIILVDFFVVALLINRSLDMFRSPLGTWIPFALIFLSTYVTGRIVCRAAA